MAGMALVIIASNNPFGEFVLPISETLGSAELEDFVPKGNISTRVHSKIPNYTLS